MPRLLGKQQALDLALTARKLFNNTNVSRLYLIIRAGGQIGDLMVMQPG